MNFQEQLKAINKSIADLKSISKNDINKDPVQYQIFVSQAINTIGSELH